MPSVSSIGGLGARSDHTASAEASRDAQPDRRMTENHVRSVGALVKKSEINCKTTGEPLDLGGWQRVCANAVVCELVTVRVQQVRVARPDP